MELKELLAQARDSMTVKRVFGEPYEKNGLTVIPVATVAGGGGGGESERGEGKDEEESTGGGFGLSTKPFGVYVIKGDTVKWEPALDLNRTILGGQVVAIAFFLTFYGIIRALIKARSISLESHSAIA